MYNCIGADIMGIQRSEPPQQFGCGGVLQLGPHENFTQINLI